jgi:hypothetical protein
METPSPSSSCPSSSSSQWSGGSKRSILQESDEEYEEVEDDKKANSRKWIDYIIPEGETKESVLAGHVFWYTVRGSTRVLRLVPFFCVSCFPSYK